MTLFVKLRVSISSMREIKFRAWDGKKMLDNPKFEFFNHGSNGRAVMMANEDENVEIMQFTGLKDKNGKECWEGDRVRFLSGMDTQEHEAEVLYKDGAFRENYFNGVLSLCPWFEVIGNMYEGETR